MDKSLLLFIAVGVIGMYYLIGSVETIQAEDDRIQNNDYKEKHRFDAYDSHDSTGQDILDLSELLPAVQIAAWNKSQIKNEYLNLFPNFSEMKHFISDRIRGEALQAKLLQSLNGVEDKFFSGDLTMEKAKRVLRNVK